MTVSRAPEPETARPELAQARVALSAAAERTAAMLRSLPDLDARLPRSEWTVGDAAAHLTIALRAFTDSVQGNAGKWAGLTPEQAHLAERVAVLNRLTIAAEPRRDPMTAGLAIVDGARAFVAASAGLTADQDIATPWYGPGASQTLAQATCLLLGEQVVHGYDIAKGLGRPWPISRADARLVFFAVQAMMPKSVMPERVGPMQATFHIHLGRSSAFIVQIRDGHAQVGPRQAGVRVDCHVAADPVALMLVGYGRISQWRAIGQGRLITWGRKPWLAFRLVGLFADP